MTGDQYTLTFNGETTDAIDYDTNLATANNKDAAQIIKDALTSLPSSFEGDFKVTRSIVGGTTQRFIVTFGGLLTTSKTRYQITNTSATSVTNLLVNGEAAIDGQLFVLRATNTNTTLRHNIAGAGKIWLKDATDRQLLTNETVFLLYDASFAGFFEIGAKARLSGLTASKAMVTDTAGVATTSTVTDTQLGFLGGATPVTSSVQAQLNTLSGVSSQPLDTELSALASTTSAPDKVPYFTGSGTATTTTLSTYGRTLIDDADALAARTTLGITATATEIGYLSGATSNIQAQISALSSGGVSDPELLAIAGLTSAANKVPYFTGSGTAATTDFVASGRALAGLTGATDTFPYYTSSAAVARTGVTLAARNLLDDPDATTMRATLGITASATEIGYLSGVSSNIQTQLNAKQAVGSYQTLDTELTALASTTSAADMVPHSWTATTTSLSAYGRTLIDDADATTARTTLGITATATEIGYLSGVTSGIQTQINTLSTGVALTPEIYGAAGNGTTDDTASLTAWLAVAGTKAATPAKPISSPAPSPSRPRMTSTSWVPASKRRTRRRRNSSSPATTSPSATSSSTGTVPGRASPRRGSSGAAPAARPSTSELPSRVERWYLHGHRQPRPHLLQLHRLRQRGRRRLQRGERRVRLLHVGGAHQAVWLHRRLERGARPVHQPDGRERVRRRFGRRLEPVRARRPALQLRARHPAPRHRDGNQLRVPPRRSRHREHVHVRAPLGDRQH